MTRRWGALLVVLGATAFVLVAATRVPWHPVPGGTPAAVPADTVFTPAQIRRATAYADGARLLGWSSLALTLMVSAWLGFTRRGAALLGDRPRSWVLRVVGLTVAVTGIGEVVSLPFVLVAWSRRRSVGLTHQDLSGLLRDQMVQLGITMIATTLVVLLLIGTARALPRAWPPVVALAACALVVGSTFLYPIVVEPAFNKFTPLPDGTLHARIDELARAEHVPLREVLVADASRRTTSANAYVSGFGGSRRVVLYDNLLHDMSEREVLSVVGHELAHARHGDVITGTALGAAGAVFGIGLLAMVLSVPGVRRRAGVTGPGDPRAVALVLALATLGSFLALPLQNAVSRELETRADVEALAGTRDPGAFASMQKHLALGALADPEPPRLAQWWFGSHPTVLQRVALARSVSR